MSWFSWFIKSDRMETFRRLIVKAIKLLIGRIVDDLWPIVKEEVEKAELTNLSGIDKWKMAMQGIKNRIGEISIPGYILAILIEVAVAEIDPKLPTSDGS